MRTAFLLAWRGLWRTRTAWTLLVLACAAAFGLPALVRSDGSAAGYREMYLKLSAGGLYAVVFLGTLAAACGVFANARRRGTLALTRVRPVSAFRVALGHWLALWLVSAVALAVLAPVVARLGVFPPAYRVVEPDLPPARVVAAEQMAAYLADPKTPEEIRRAPRAAVLDLLTNREGERYETVAPGETAHWTFPARGTTLRIRFAAPGDNRVTVRGTFAAGGRRVPLEGAFGTSVDVPLTAAPDASGVSEVTFRNNGTETLLYRPRRDVTLRNPCGTLIGNAVRAYAAMLSATALAAAFGLLLSAFLSKPVALFAAFALMAAASIAPDAAEAFPDEFHATVGERLALWISRRTADVAETFSDFPPVGRLATDTAIGASELVRTSLRGVVVAPLLLLTATAFVLRRREER